MGSYSKKTSKFRGFLLTPFDRIFANDGLGNPIKDGGQSGVFFKQRPEEHK